MKGGCGLVVGRGVTAGMNPTACAHDKQNIILRK
jgi:hypothetical protein